MNSYQAYVLRMQLVSAGYFPIPCKDGKPVLPFWGVPTGLPTEGYVRSWAEID
jgi:hypothetical protein